MKIDELIIQLYTSPEITHVKTITFELSVEVAAIPNVDANLTDS